jgi:undecaprenyl-diphosphatase
MELFDKIKGIDAGTYYFFDFVGKQYRDILPVMELANSLAGYVGSVVLLVLAVIVFVVRGRKSLGVVSLIVFAIAAAGGEGLRHLIARRRPDDAQDMLGAANMIGSYPAVGVLLFTLALILLTVALTIGAPRLRRVLLSVLAALIIVLVCLSQFFLRLHFMTDVVAGLMGGSACALLTWLLVPPTRVSDPGLNA